MRYKFFPFFLVFYEIAIYLSNDSFLPALPEMAKDLGTSNNLAQLTFTLWFLGGLSVQLLLGPLADRYGRRPIFFIGGIVFVISNVMCALAPNIYVLFIGRFIQGAAVPSMIIAGYATIHEFLPNKEATKILAKMLSVVVLAPLLGPLLGSGLLLIGSWRWIFILLTLWSAFALSILYFKMPEMLPKEKRPASISFNIVKKQYGLLLTNLRFLQNILAGTFSISTLIMWMLLGPFIVVDQFHYKIIYFSLFQGLIFGSFIIGTQLIKIFIEQYDRDKLATSALVVSLMGACLLIIGLYYFPYSLLLTIMLLMLQALSSGLCFPLLNRLAVEASDVPMGARMSIISTISFAIIVLTTVIVSFFYNQTLFSLAVMALGFSSLAFIIKWVVYKLSY